MRILVIGLGSMGKRRVRNLQSLGIRDVAGFDVREDRRDEASGKYGIPVFGELNAAIEVFRPQAFVISTPPDLHMQYAYHAFDKGLSCFIEASVVDAEKIRELHGKTENTPILMMPSCTMRYFPGPKKVKELVRSNAIGKVLNINYQTGQYLPDWHPWEPIGDYYVSRRETGAAREIVPFELTWLNDIFGKPQALACVRAKLTDMPADIDDIYHCLMRYEGGVLASMTVEVISRPQACRDLRILGSEGEIVMSGDFKSVRYINTSMEEWIEFKFDAGTVENQYINPEEPYIAEMKDFIAAVESGDSSRFPNTLMDDYEVLQTLSAFEKISIIA